MHVNGALFHIDIAAPHGIEQLFTAEHTAGMLEEMAQQAEFRGAELHGAAVAGHPMSGRIHGDAGKFQRAALQGRAQTPQHRADTRNELARGKRLGHVIVRTGFEAADTIRLVTAGGKHDDRQIGGGRRAAQAAADFDARKIGDHPVEDNQIGLLLFGQGQRFLTISGADHVKAFLFKIIGHKLNKAGVIFNKQDLGAHGAISWGLFGAVNC